MNAVDAIDAWCSFIMDNMVLGQIELDPSAEIARVVVPTNMRPGTIIKEGDEEIDDILFSPKEVAENDYKLSHFAGNLVSDLIKRGALEILSSRLNPKIFVSISNSGIKSLAYEKFATGKPNPEEKYVVRCAYARTRMTLRATYYDQGVPDSVRALAEKTCASF